MRLLLKSSLLRALSLVNMHHSPESFDLIIQYLQESETLQELDLSWSIVKPSHWVTFMEAIRDNRKLTCLSLSFNQLMEEQSYKPEESEDEADVELTWRNQEIIDHFKQFIKYNPFLINLDL